MTEYANARRESSTISACQSIARWAGVSVQTVARAAAEGRLASFIESRQHIRPLRGPEALRRLEETRHAPGSRHRSPYAALGKLRAMQTIWEEEEEDHRRRDPNRRLAQLRAKQIPPWAQ
jgi:hypothetical protein